ncbi:hypothetical protein F5883DRAFT_711426 [Diaporthe sp. PMI_573]|nr:hypothetical protein F5883DRAFT_711426 [Diaporthaceae sp. PMI_573]
MAAISVLPSIGGLQRPLTSEDLELSRTVHNRLVHPEEQPEISDATLKALGELFVRNDAQAVFGIHLLHSHFVAPKGTVLLGIEAQLSKTSTACWTKPIPAAQLTHKAVHSYVFSLQSDGIFVPYKLQEGKVDAKVASIQPAFFQELAAFLHSNNLADLVALQLLDGSESRKRIELLVGPQATLMVDKKDLIGFNLPCITTSWTFTVRNNGIISCKGNNVYSAKKNTHQVFQDSKPLPTVEALLEALRGEGIIA